MAYNPLYLIFFILALVYTVLTLFATIRTVRLHRFSPHWGHTKCFYLTVISTTLMRTVAFFVIFLQEVSDLSSFFLLLSVPDSVFTLAFLLLFWQLVIVFSQAHMDDLMAARLLRTEGRLTKSRLPPYIFACSIGSNRRKASLLRCIGWLLLQVVLYLLYLLDAISSVSIGDEVGAANILFPTVVLVTILMQHIKYAGIPRKSQMWSSKLKKVRLITFVWCGGRYIRGVLSLITALTDYSLSREVINNDTNVDISRVSVLIAYLIICEVICIFLVLDYSFISIFAFIEAEQNDALSSLELNTDSADSVRNSLATEDTPMRAFPPIVDRPLVLASDCVLEAEFRSRKGGLGVLFSGKVLGNGVLIRKIVFSRISGYVIEEFEEEIQSLRTVNVPYVLPVHCAAINLPEVWLVTPSVSPGSLFDLLHVEKHFFPFKTRLEILLKLARGLTSIYELGRKHGHLSSHNVLLDKNYCPYVSDLGMFKLKKYAGLLMNYCNKSAWSSPELLLESCATALKFGESDDVYSFGVISWELLTGQEPFPGISRAKLVQMVAKDKLRPEIPRSVDDRLSELIKSCWNTEPTRRPTFSMVANTLELLLGVIDE